MLDPLTLQPTVESLASQYYAKTPPNVLLDDLLQAGWLGALDATESYNPKAKVSLKNFARHRIKGAILDELRDGDGVSRLTRKRIKRVKQAISDATERLKRPVEAHEVAEEMGLELDEFYELQVKIQGRQTLSFDNHVLFNTEDGPEQSDEVSYIDAFIDEETPHSLLDEKERNQELQGAIGTLPERTQTMVWLYFWEEHTLKEIGEFFEITESRSSQILTRACETLGKRLNGRYKD